MGNGVQARRWAWVAMLIIAGAAVAEVPSTRPAAFTIPAEAPFIRETRTEIAELPAPPLAPRNVADLKVVQSRVEAVVKAVLPATVGLLVDDGQGSGVIVSRDGYVLTAGHVSGKPGQEVAVVLANGQRLRGKSLGMNKPLDSGMVKITSPAPSGGWPFVPVGLSSKLTQGQWVVALGHPGGYQRTRPPVLRLGRVALLQKKNNVVTTLSTDCPLIMGDSGGPLFDLDGRLVGINSRIGLGNAMNFHVPVDIFTATWKALASGEEVGAGPTWFARGKNEELPPAPQVPVRPKLGIRGESVSGGVLVTDVTVGTAAEDAGLQRDDLITRFEGQAVLSLEELADAVGKYRPGDKVTLDYRRGGTAKRITMKLGSEQP